MRPATDDTAAHTLAEIRARIDDTDGTLLRPLDQRIEFALCAGRLKTSVAFAVRLEHGEDGGAVAAHIAGGIVAAAKTRGIIR
jgi:hypothetical protein